MLQMILKDHRNQKDAWGLPTQTTTIPLRKFTEFYGGFEFHGPSSWNLGWASLGKAAATGTPEMQTWDILKCKPETV